MTLPEHIRTEVETKVSESLAKMLDAEEAAEILAAFVDGKAVLVFTKDQLSVIPRSHLVVAPVEDTPPGYGLYL